MTEPTPPHSDQLADLGAMRFGPLVGLTARQWRRAMDVRLAELKLTQATWVPLLQLARSSKPMRQKDLAAALAVDSSSVVRILKMLAADGLVERAQDQVDGRAKAIRITDTGRALADRAERVSETLDRELLAAIPDDQIASARALMVTINTYLLATNTLDAPE